MHLPIFRNSAGKPDAMLTFAWVTLHVVLLRVLLAGITVAGITCAGIDTGLAGVLLSSTLGAYVARRNQIGVKSPAPVDGDTR